MKYPNIIFFRFEKYSYIDTKIINNSQYQCNFNITTNIKDLNKLYNPNYHLLITCGDDEKEYHPYILPNLLKRFCDRWIHKSITGVQNIDQFNKTINYCYINNVIRERKLQRPVFSIFTTCYNTWEKFDRVYNSILSQKFIDWEWVIIDDTPINYKNHFEFLREKCKSDCRIRLYCRSENSGNIGNVKNEAISLCRGQYLLELDHDDEILPDCLLDAVNIFNKDNSIGFIYMDFANIYENGDNFKYNDFICKGYGGYYCQKYKERWINVYMTPNINNITLSHLVCCPNHPRIWRKSVLLELGNYSEFLPICDDYEVLLRTAINTKIVKINKLAYIQYMNNDNNNFSLIRNSEINRIGPYHISPQFYAMYNVDEKMQELNAYENKIYIHQHSQIWKRENYTHKYCNDIINLDYEKQYCIINDSIDNKELVELYKNPRNDFLFLSNNLSHDEMIQKLESKGFDRMKYYLFTECSEKQLVSFFKLLYANSNCEHIILQNNYDIIQLDSLNTMHIKNCYETSSPFKHIILDNIINNNLLNKAVEEIKSISLNDMQSDLVFGIENVQINKFCYRDFNKLTYITQIKNYFESQDFINWLQIITNINNLQKDTTYNGSGIHIIKQNGKLCIHSDFNRHKTSKKYRRLNLLLYMNKDYKNNYNGHLELWNPEMTKCEVKIAPIFNRIVIFKVDDDANHGHPEPWNGGNNDRISLALYYYTDDRPEHEKSEIYNAVWKTPMKPKCYIIHNNTVGGAYKYLTDIMDTYPDYKYEFISSKKQLFSLAFNKNDILLLQNVLYTDIAIYDIINVHKSNFKLIIPIHDFQWLCKDQHNYSYKIPNSYLDKEIDIVDDIKVLLSIANKVIMNSQFSYDIYSKYFDSTNFIISYPNDYRIRNKIINIPKIINNCINIGVFSPLCRFKGEKYINYLRQKYENNNIKFCIVGDNIPYYKEREFYNHIKKYNINGFLLLNEWGETYCYLLTKIINSGLPLLYNNFGALKERLIDIPEHYFKVYDDENIDDVIIDYTILDRQFNNFIEYINTNNGVTEEMNEDFTLLTNPIYDRLFLSGVELYQNREIPKHIFQTSKAILPPYIKELINIYCPGWEYLHFTDKDCIHFFTENPISEFTNIIQKFNSFSQGQHKADLFRYYYLYLRGGVFLDSDAMFETNIKNIILDYDSVFAKSFMKNEHLFNGFIATYPRNKIIYNALKHAYYTENYTLQSNYHYLCEELLKIVTREQNSMSKQNMLIYQEYSDTIDGMSVGKFKNDNNETLFIHYWQTREIPNKLSKLLDTYSILNNIYKSNDIPDSHIIFLKQLSNHYKPNIIYDIGSCVLHWTQHAHQIWKDSEVYLFDAMEEYKLFYETYDKYKYKYTCQVLCDSDNKQIDFYQNNLYPAGNSYYKEIGHNKSYERFTDNHIIKKNGLTLSTVIKNKKIPLPDLIKIDVQGCELDIIKGSMDIINSAKYLIVELQHTQYNEGAPLCNITRDFLIENSWQVYAEKFSNNGPDADWCFINTRYNN